MKKIFKFGLLTNLALIVGLQFSLAQNKEFIPMLNPGAIWFETYTNHTPNPFGYNWSGRKYLGLDTIINNTTYKKIYHEMLDVFCTEIILSGPTYAGALREDALHKKVWFIPPYFQQEILYFDFTLEIGDTVAESYFTWETPYTLIVSDIDTITTFDGAARKRWLFDSDPMNDESFVIEGIGFSGGLLQPYEIWQFYINHLWNFHIDTTLIYCHHLFGCEIPSDTCMSVGITTPLRDFDISIYPNPVTNVLYLTTHGDSERFNAYEIYNLSGLKVAEGRFFNNSYAIPVDYLGSGMYLLRIKNELNAQNFKFIKK